MGLFDIFLGRKKEKQTTIAPATVAGERKPIVNAAVGNKPTGHIDVEKNGLDVPTFDALKKTFIAFDIETTGLSPTSDRIVELGAVLFVNGLPTKTFSSLVNPGISISPSASAVNHITNDMLYTAPSEDVVYPDFIDFLGNALSGEVVMCAHNASFDFGFLSNTLSRLGYYGKICYVDTLSLSRIYIPGLDNYKQCTLENYFALDNTASHRATSDAGNCGRILTEILSRATDGIEEERKRNELALPAKEELAVCAYIQKIIAEGGNDVSRLRFRKSSDNYIEVSCLYTFVKFKFAKKGHYIILKTIGSAHPSMISEPCTASEGGTDYTRFYFSRAFDLHPFAKDIVSLFKKTQKSMSDYLSCRKHAAEEVRTILSKIKALTEAEVEELLLEESQKDGLHVEVPVDSPVPRDSIIVSAKHSRVPLNEIKNANDWKKGFDEGFKYYEKGEVARRSSHIDEAITLYDKARYHGYCAPALYNAYAVAYRQIKDYDNEIVILEEGMLREPRHIGEFEARRNKALKLLISRRDFIEKHEEKAQKKVEEKAAKETEKINKQPNGRRILQMDDAGTIIAEFETIAAATREVGISSKSIRDAANGIQKHAGGYCWKFRENIAQS